VQKREAAKKRHFTLRLNLFFFLTFVVFSILIIRLALLQFVEGPSLKTEESRMTAKPVPIPPIRGTIYDSTGFRIAYSTSTQSLYFRLETGMKEEDARALAEELARVFERYGDKTGKPLAADDILKLMDLNSTMNNGYVPRRIKTGLTNEEVAYFLERRDEFPLLEIVEESVRNYDPSRIAVQLVGYLKKYNAAISPENGLEYYRQIEENETDLRKRYSDQEDVGFDGIELMYEEQLRGKSGIKEYPVNPQQYIIGPPTITEPEKGNNLYLTIHKDVQLATQEAIVNHLKKLNTSTNRIERSNAKTGYAVAMEVKTGKVIAMASMPDYDPNVWKGGRISPEDWSSAGPYLSNGTIRSVYPNYDSYEEQIKHPSSLVYLGSTMKPLTVLIGLNEKLITPNTRYNDRGVFYYGAAGIHRRSIRNSQGHVYGLMDPARAIEKSSNTFMAEMVGNALAMRDGKKGVEIWDNYLKQFGLGVLTGSGLPNESKGIVEYFHEMENASAQSALIFASFGQQGRYTTLQLAQYAATLANRGKRMKPQFVEKITDAQGNVVQTFEPEVLNEIEIPDAYWKEVEQGMLRVNARGFEDTPYPVARKTGTSEQDLPGGRVDNAVFIAYAPADDPRLAVAVVVPEGGFGSYGAAPIARAIFDAYDKYIGMYGKPNPQAYENAEEKPAE
jgi:penicillin-binding protein 2